MSENAKPPETPVVDKPAEQPAQTAEKPKGYDPVDIDGLQISDESKQQIKDRIDYIYKQAKEGKSSVAALKKHNELLDRTLNEVQSRLGTVETKAIHDERGKIKEEIKLARMNNDVDRELALTDQLGKLADKPKGEPKPEVKTGYAWETDTTLQNYVLERDESGSLRRPWTIPTHPDHQKAADTTMKIYEEAQREGRQVNVDYIFAELDKRMTPKRQSATVLPSTGQRPAVTEKTKPSLMEEQVARKMGIPIEKYMKQKAVISRTA